MADLGHKRTNKKLKKLESRLNSIYRDAYKTVRGKLSHHLAKYKEKDEIMRAKVDNGEISEDSYLSWRRTQMMQTRAFTDLSDTLAAELTRTTEIAAGMINGHTEDVYCLNMNYGTYEVESGTRINTSFALYDHATIENLMKKDPQIIPQVNPNIPKTQQWNQKNITSAVASGILSGDSIPQIASRLEGVTNMNLAQSVRAARTYTTAAENKGRVDSYERAEKMGIHMQQQWLATVDTRTRPSHIALDHKKIKVGEKFPNGCRFPGDPDAPPEERWNCRCTLIAALDDFEYEGNERAMNLPAGITFEQWKSWGRETWASTSQSKTEQKK